LADEGTEICVVGGVEVFKRGPLSNVYESEARVGDQRAMKLVADIPSLAAHMRVDLLPQCEKFILSPTWDLEAINQCYSCHLDHLLLAMLPRDSRTVISKVDE
jgi:hypothetical protein